MGEQTRLDAREVLLISKRGPLGSAAARRDPYPRAVCKDARVSYGSISCNLER